jgi:malate synthase
MEDAATAEIARSQVWQWIRHGRFEREHVRRVIDEELERLRETFGDEAFERSRAAEARELFEQVALGDELEDFLTVPAYAYLERASATGT